MSTVEMKKSTKSEPVSMKLEVVLLGVSDVERAKAFYETSVGGSTSTSHTAIFAVCR